MENMREHMRKMVATSADAPLDTMVGIASSNMIRRIARWIAKMGVIATMGGTGTNMMMKMSIMMMMSMKVSMKVIMKMKKFFVSAPKDLWGYLVRSKSMLVIIGARMVVFVPSLNLSTLKEGIEL